MAHSENASRGGSRGGASGPLLRAQLSIEPDRAGNCAVIEEGGDAQDISQHLKTDSSTFEHDTVEHTASGGECHTQMTVTDGMTDDRAYVKSPITTGCICPVFQEHDCIPEIKETKAGSIIVVISFPERETLREVIHDLRAVGASVTVEWLVDGNDCRATMEIDVCSITDKQREAMDVALEKGYYETPRRTDLGELSEELGISESAASQRLNAAETKLVKSFLED